MLERVTPRVHDYQPHKPIRTLHHSMQPTLGLVEKHLLHTLTLFFPRPLNILPSTFTVADSTSSHPPRNRPDATEAPQK